MRLFRRGKSYYVEFKRGVKRSLKTSDKKEAERIFRIIKRKHLEGKLIQLDRSERITLEEYIKLYLESRFDLSEGTLNKDKIALGLFADVIGKSKTLKLIRESDIEAFKKACLTRRVKKLSINSYLRHIRTALNQAHESGFIEKPVKIKMLKSGRYLPRVLSSDEIKKLLDYSDKKDPEFSRIISFALWTGCRKAEIIGLTWQDVKGEKAIIKGKGDKERVVPLVAGALVAMGPVKDLGPIFKQYSLTWVSQKFKKFARACGIEDAHFHTLRHSSATHMISSGIKLEVVQKILGHSSITTTQIYAQVVDDLVRDEMEKLKF
jgi:site-specific recombinase XerD